MLQSMGSQRVGHGLVPEHRIGSRPNQWLECGWFVLRADGLAPECGFSAHLGGWLIRWSFQCPEWLGLLFHTP